MQKHYVLKALRSAAVVIIDYAFDTIFSYL